jgi:ribosome-associated toxin RatA of RatAB toxin-antitoxin module
MKQSIQSNDSRQLNARADEAYAVVSDFAEFGSWFPAPVTVLRSSPHVVGSEVEVTAPDGGPRFVMEVTGISPGARIDLRYRGDFTGTGRWTFQDGRAGLEVDLSPNTLPLKVFALLGGMKKAHVGFAASVLDALQDRVTQVRGDA